MGRGEHVVVGDEAASAEVLPLPPVVVLAQAHHPGDLLNRGRLALVRQARLVGNSTLFIGRG